MTALPFRDCGRQLGYVSCRFDGADFSAPSGSRGGRSSRKCRGDARQRRFEGVFGCSNRKRLQGGGRNLQGLRLCSAESGEETADETVFFTVYSGTVRRPVRLGVRIRAISRGLRFEIRIAHAKRSRQSQLEYSEQQQRKSGALDQLIYSKGSTTSGVRGAMYVPPTTISTIKRATE